MSEILSIALGGLNQAVARATQSAHNVVNASSTGKNVDADLIDLKIASLDYKANAAVAKTAMKMHKSLLDTIA